MLDQSVSGPKLQLGMMIPPEMDDELRAIIQSVNDAMIRVLGATRARELGILRPVTEVTLQPPHTDWRCYWSYVYAYWTYFYAYWNYIINDAWLGYYTLVYAYYSYVYAYYCYLVC